MRDPDPNSPFKEARKRYRQERSAAMWGAAWLGVAAVVGFGALVALVLVAVLT